MFSEQDLQQIKSRGSDVSVVEQQLENFKKGFPPLTLKKAPSVASGIIKIEEKEKEKLIAQYDQQSAELDLLKFVPASGAATRMFKALFAFLADYDGSDESYEAFVAKGEADDTFKLLKHLEDFAFYEDLKKAYQQRYGESLEEGHLKRAYTQIIDTLLNDEGLSYGSLPKALLKFHQYDEGARTSLEEHFVEGAQYAKGSGDVVNLHFTVSPAHQEKFEAKVAEVKAGYQERFGVSYNVSYSIQKPSTDTIAVDMEDQPFRNDDGSILFRPAGHGALIENLNEVEADVIFIKNVDNVVPEKIQQTTYDYKKVLAGLLLSAKSEISSMIKALEGADSSTDLSAIETFLTDKLHNSDEQYDGFSASEKIAYLKKKLNRPVRVCGVVKNDGDPGGGPFFAQNPDGSVSLQIVETAQVDKSDEGQLAIFKQTTHFNPVDLVCSTRDYQGKKFDLLGFRDSDTGFITQKSKDGKDLKAQELPGLWNGAMSDWITLLAEVPVITFNPVKSVTDLLKDEHQ
ncbi:MAG: DUF4301 family protein [Bacteroidota bacterium]